MATEDPAADEIDDDWDWDTELGLLEPEPEPCRRPWVAPAPSPPAPLERDLRLAALDADTVGEFLRACRATAGLSQRALAEAAGVPRATVGRLEAGDGRNVQLATLVRLTTACGVTLVGVRGPAREPILSDLAQRHRDAGGRVLPAHLLNAPVEPWHGGWWGDDRYTHRRSRPRRSVRAGQLLRDVPLDAGAGSDLSPPAADTRPDR